MELSTIQIFWLLSLTALVVTVIITWLAGQDREKKIDEDRVAKAQHEQKEAPTKNFPYFKELYFLLLPLIDTNVRQSRYIYRLVIILNCVGLLIIGYAIFEGSLLIQNFLTIGQFRWSALVAGIAIELVALATLFLYRSFSTQTESHLQMLERLTSLGLSIRLLDESLTDVVVDDIKNDTKIRMAKLLLELQYGTSVQIESRETESTQQKQRKQGMQ